SHRGVDVGGLTHHVDEPGELRPHPAAEHGVVVHDHDRPHPTSSRFILSRTSVPCSGVDLIVAVPPCRSILATMLLRTPSRSGGTSSGSNPVPRSRTKTSTSLSPTSA